MEQVQENHKIVLKVLSTLLAMYILTGAALFLLAFLLYKLELTEQAVSVGIMIIYVIAGLFGGLVIGKRIRRRRFLWGIFVGACYFAVLFLGSFLLNRGLTSDALHSIMALLMCTGAGMIGGMLS